MADPLYLRQYQDVAWWELDANQQQAVLLEVEKQAQEDKRTLLRNKPTHVIKLNTGYTYMWDLVP